MLRLFCVKSSICIISQPSLNYALQCNPHSFSPSYILFTIITHSHLCLTSFISYRNIIPVLFIDSLASGSNCSNFHWVIFKHINYHLEHFKWNWFLVTDMSTVVQVMAWCHQTPSHYLNQCWPRSSLPYGVTRPQLVKCLCHQLQRY